MAASPTSRSLEVLRLRGYLCQVVERFNPHARLRQDLFGFIDVLAVKDEEVLGVQATSGSHVADRINKIVEHPNWPIVCKAMRIAVWGWSKNAKGRWVLREEEL